MSVRNCGELGLNLQKIIMRLMANDNLINLLYYTNIDPLSSTPLTQEEKNNKVFNQLIKMIPNVAQREDEKSVVAIYIVKGEKNGENGEFREISIMVDIIVPFTQWVIKDTDLRPFAILGEIQNSLEGKTVNGLGKITGGDFFLTKLTDENSIYSQTFYIQEYV